MDEYRMAEDPIAFAKEAAETLAPLGVRYFEFKGLKLAFESPLAGPVAAAAIGGAVQANGLTGKEEAELERLMEADSASDPLDDPATFPGGMVPSYSARRPTPRQRQRATAPEMED